MFGITEFIFGVKKEVTIVDLGTFKANVRNITSKNIIWEAIIKSKLDKELAIALIGNANKPFSSQIETVKFIITNNNSISNQIVSIINKKEELTNKFKNENIADYALKEINPWRKGEISYELLFQSKLKNNYLGAIFKNGKITEVYI